jgi:hypothetical protein
MHADVAQGTEPYRFAYVKERQQEKSPYGEQANGLRDGFEGYCSSH